MKYIPALYNTLMIERLLKKQKTQTRRLGKLDLINKAPNAWRFVSLGTNPDNEKDERLYAYFNLIGTDTWHYSVSPFGKKDDVLWVRETWSYEGFKDNYVYKADGLCLLSDDDKWYPSIFMSKQACRIFLKIANVRIERLNDISDNDSIAEGCFPYGPFGEYAGALHPSGGAMKYRAYSEPVYAYKSIWEDINGDDSWKKNPFVWVYDFEQVEGPEEF